jgi:hypothetical protein
MFCKAVLLYYSDTTILMNSTNFLLQNLNLKKELKGVQEALQSSLVEHEIEKKEIIMRREDSMAEQR